MVRHSQSPLSSARGIILFLFFILPLLLLFSKFSKAQFVVPNDFLWAFKNSLLQSFTAAALSLLFGFFSALGLAHLDQASKWRRMIENILVLPNLLPSLFILVFVLRWIDPFPFGNIGVALVQCLVAFGFVAVSFARYCETEFSKWTELALIENASRFQLLRALWSPLSGKLRSLFLSVFAFSFASFTIPLALGGGKGTNLEVLIFEKIRIDGDFSSALWISFLQFVFVFFLSHFLLNQDLRKSVSGRLRILPSRVLSFFLFVGGFLFVSAFAYELVESFSLGWQIPQFADQLWALVGPSVLGVFRVWLILSLLFAMMISLASESRIVKSLTAFFSLSAALIGFSYFSLFGENSFWGISFGLSSLFFIPLWRIYGFESHQSLRHPVEMAELMGAGPMLIFFKVRWPLMQESWIRILQISTYWTLGDFALTKMIATGSPTLGTFAQNLMNSYRIHSAFLVVMLLLILGFFVNLILKVAFDVGRSRS